MYNITYHEEVQNDFKKLGNSTTILVLKKIEQIAKNPIIGDNLGNKVNNMLSGLKKVYVDKKRVRIVYKIIDNKVEIFIIAVGKREDMEVYKKANLRLK